MVYKNKSFIKSNRKTLKLKSTIRKPWRFRERSERPGFFSLFGYFFSFLFIKKREKVTRQFEIKEELKLKSKSSL